MSRRRPPPLLRCQACGFTVFNRRYPRCESCGVALDPALLLTDVERRSRDAEMDRTLSSASAGIDRARLDPVFGSRTREMAKEIVESMLGSSSGLSSATDTDSGSDGGD